MTDQGVEDQTDRREKDLERSDHSEKDKLDKLIEENEGHEEMPWPGVNNEELMSIGSLVCFFCNLIVIPTGFTFFLEKAESRDGLVCRRYLRQRASQILESIGRAQSKMGSGKSKQENEGATIDKQIGVDMESLYSLLDLRGWHASSIGILIIIIIIVLGVLLCARRRYKRLHKEVMLHRSRRNTKEKSHTMVVDDQGPNGRFPELQMNDTVINKDSLQRLRMAAANGTRVEVD